MSLRMLMRRVKYTSLRVKVGLMCGVIFCLVLHHLASQDSRYADGSLSSNLRIFVGSKIPVADIEAELRGMESTEDGVLTLDRRVMKLIANRFKNRNEIVQGVCERKQQYDPSSGIQLKSVNDSFANKHYQFCRIPGAASSFLNKLDQNLPKATSQLVMPSTQAKHQVMMVREPYSRVLSAYLDLVVSPESWEQYGTKIITKFRVNPSLREMKYGNNVTFHEFVMFVIYSHETGWLKNDHVALMSEICSPCERKFDFIAHLETLKEDISFFLQYANFTVNNTLSDAVRTIKKIGRNIFSMEKLDLIEGSDSRCNVLQRVWWVLQARGLISKFVPFPLLGTECNMISEDSFIALCLQAHADSLGRIDKERQRREALVELYRQVPLNDRITLRDALAMDLELFDYDRQPYYLFPELRKGWI